MEPVARGTEIALLADGPSFVIEIYIPARDNDKPRRAVGDRSAQPFPPDGWAARPRPRPRPRPARTQFVPFTATITPGIAGARLITAGPGFDPHRRRVTSPDFFSFFSPGRRLARTRLPERDLPPRRHPCHSCLLKPVCNVLAAGHAVATPLWYYTAKQGGRFLPEGREPAKVSRGARHREDFPNRRRSSTATPRWEWSVRVRSLHYGKVMRIAEIARDASRDGGRFRRALLPPPAAGGVSSCSRY